MLSEVDGYKIIKSIHRKSKACKNESLFSICERTLELIENKCATKRLKEFFVEDFSLFRKSIEKNQLMEIKLSQIINSLLRYKHRQIFVKQNLIRLYDCTISCCEFRPQLIELIVVLMTKHPEVNEIQENSLTCSNNLIAYVVKDKNSAQIIVKLVDLTILAMESFPNNEQLHKKALVILVTVLNGIFQDIPVDRYKCAKVAMDSLVKFKNTDMNYHSLEICLNISNELTIVEKSNLFLNPAYMDTLLALAISRVQFTSEYDKILEYTLSIFTNLTEESPEVCELFIEKGGLELCSHILNVSFRFFYYETFYLCKNLRIY
jgi:Zyg-11 family protein